jgi:hypothetical protein
MVEHSDQLRFCDHSCLDLSNPRVIGLGPDPAFDIVVIPREENGEVFLSKCHKEQEKRKSTVGQDKMTELRNCRHSCEACVPPKPTCHIGTPAQACRILSRLVGLT